MVIGVPTEIKTDEYRVSLVPAGAEVLTGADHTVLVQAGAGLGTSLADAEYAAHGAEIVEDPAEIWRRSDLVVKVKEPLPPEYPLIRPGQVIFTYYHFAASEELTRAMLQRGPICVAYETIQEEDGTLPLLTPMS